MNFNFEEYKNKILIQEIFEKLNNLKDFQLIFFEEKYFNFICDEIIKFYERNVFYLNSLIDFIDFYCNNINNKNIFLEKLINKSITHFPILIYHLFKKNYYEITFIKDKIDTYFASIIFIEYIEDFNSFTSTFWDYDSVPENFHDYLSHDFKLIEEFIQFGWEKNSLGYLIKFDEYESFIKLFHNFSNSIKLFSLFDPSLKNKLSLLELSAHYGSINIFKFIFLNVKENFNHDLLIKESIFGNNYEIIQLLNQYFLNIENYLQFSSNYRRIDLFKFFFNKYLNLKILKVINSIDIQEIWSLNFLILNNCDYFSKNDVFFNFNLKIRHYYI